MTIPDTPPGSRLSVRYAAADGVTELVGEVVTRDSDSLTLLPEGRASVVLELARIEAARLVPPRRVRPTSPIEDVEMLAARGWPGQKSERFGGWLLRAGSGGSGRANSTLPIGDPGLPVPEAVDAVVSAYEALDLRPQFQLPEQIDPRAGIFRRPPTELVAELERRWWVASPPTTVMVGDLRRMDEATQAGLRSGTPTRLTWAEVPEDAFWALEGSTPQRQAEALAAPAWYALLRDSTSGSPVAVGRLALVDDWCGVSNLLVRADRRGTGLGRRALATLLAGAWEAGARFAYLQVLSDNAAARGLYSAHGFVDHHVYRYVGPP